MTFSTRAGVLGAHEQILGFCFVDWKKRTTLKLRIIFYSGTLLRTIVQEGNLSDNSEGLIQRGKGGTRIYRSFYWEKRKIM